MRDPARISRILGKLEKAWKESPDMRLCQLLDGAVGGEDTFYLEDDKLERALDRWITEHALERRKTMLKNGEFPHCEGCGKPTGEYRRGTGFEATYWCAVCIPDDARFYPGHEPNKEERP